MKIKKQKFIWFITLSVIIVILVYGGVSYYTRNFKVKSELILATTTSTYDTGLLDYLVPIFEKQNNCIVKVIAVGTGQALALGKNGDADCLLVHAKKLELEFMNSKDGLLREDVMYNDFVIVGRDEDPANVKNAKSAEEAMRQIALTKSIFISRGDDSGTHTKEKSIWKNISLNPEGSWYISAGQGMAEVLTMANEKNAYTLTDRGTYLKFFKEGKILLKVLFEKSESLLNYYGVIVVNPELHPKVNVEYAKKFLKFITSVETQLLIKDFGVKEYGAPLFFPNSKEYKEKYKTP